MKSCHITISGDTYGHGIRFRTMHAAYELGIKGNVRYNPAGSIVIEAEGDKERLEKFIALLRTFIQTSKISDFSFVETTPKGYSSFEIRNDAFGEETAIHSILFVRYMNLFFWKIQRMFGSKNTRL